MGGLLRQSTAAVIPFGPFLDKTDGVTLEVAAGIITSIDHATTGIFLSKNGGAGAIRHQAVTASTLDAYGMFLVTLDTTDTNTLGRLRVMMSEAATFLPVWDDYMVIPADLWDTLFVAQPAAAIKKFFNMASPTGTVNSLPDAVAGAAGGVAIAGSNAATTFATLSVTGQLDAGNVLVDGTTVLTGATTLTGAVSLGSTLGVTGASTLASLSVTGQLDVGNVLVDTTTALTGAVTAPAGITANLTGDITGTLATVTTLTNKTGFSLANTGADLILKTSTFTQAVVDAINEEVAEGTITHAQLQRILLSFISGIATGGETTTITFKDLANTKARITMTVDTNGNRSAVTLDGA